jgi:hypothetical protein
MSTLKRVIDVDLGNTIVDLENDSSLREEHLIANIDVFLARGDRNFNDQGRVPFSVAIDRFDPNGVHVADSFSSDSAIEANDHSWLADHEREWGTALRRSSRLRPFLRRSQQNMPS